MPSIWKRPAGSVMARYSAPTNCTATFESASPPRASTTDPRISPGFWADAATARRSARARRIRVSKMIAPLYHFGMRERIRFGIFDFDPDSRELRREGAPVRLQAQPAQVLAALVTRAGEVVTREELRQT